MAKYKGNGSDNIINGSLDDDMIYGKGGQDMLYGEAGNDFIDAGVGDDFLFGGDGDDILFGGKGNDTMDGGLGADTFRGGKGRDTVDYSTSTTGVMAYLGTNQSGDGAAGDSYEKVENVIGSAYDDRLQNSDGGDAFGGAGADVIYGGAGQTSTDDGGRIRGDAGIDTLRMDFGNTRAWLQNGQGYDVVRYFNEDEDMLFIDLSDFGLGNTLDSNEIRISSSATADGTHAQFIYEYDAQNLWFDSNGTDAGGLVLVARFEDSNILDNNLGLNDFEYQV
ncbi:MAG: hypothetical protein KL863_07175 [Rhizobium sp.]|nr:hypothetical protein [Rhizobium sp.]